MSDAPAFYARPSLNIESYDARADLAALEGDVDFYLRLAEAADGPVLDLGGGTGRVAWPLAERGYEVTTLDISGAMLAASRAKAPQRHRAGPRIDPVDGRPTLHERGMPCTRVSVDSTAHPAPAPERRQAKRPWPRCSALQVSGA